MQLSAIGCSTSYTISFIHLQAESHASPLTVWITFWHCVQTLFSWGLKDFSDSWSYKMDYRRGTLSHWDRQKHGVPLYLGLVHKYTYNPKKRKHSAGNKRTHAESVFLGNSGNGPCCLSHVSEVSLNSPWALYHRHVNRSMRVCVPGCVSPHCRAKHSLSVSHP